MTVQPDPYTPGAFADSDDNPRSGLVRALKLGGAGILTVFLAGGAAGAFAAMAEDRHYSAKGIALLALFALAAIAAGVWFVRLLRRARAVAPETARVTRARQMLVVSGAIGGVLGLLFAVDGMADPTFTISDASMSPMFALVTLAIIGIAVPAVTLVWHRSVDEHEEHVYRFASLIAIYTYFWVSLMWWIAARGGCLPPVDGKAIFGIVWAVWGLAWVWRKYR